MLARYIGQYNNIEPMLPIYSGVDSTPFYNWIWQAKYCPGMSPNGILPPKQVIIIMALWQCLLIS